MKKFKKIIKNFKSSKNKFKNKNIDLMQSMINTNKFIFQFLQCQK